LPRARGRAQLLAGDGGLVVPIARGLRGANGYLLPSEGSAARVRAARFRQLLFYNEAARVALYRSCRVQGAGSRGDGLTT
jgi:hypothetical protein